MTITVAVWKSALIAFALWIVESRDKGALNSEQESVASVLRNQYQEVMEVWPDFSPAIVMR
jgi:hypothetical protein